MSFDPLTGALDLGAKLVDRLIPDPAAKGQAAAQLLQLKASGELARMTADTDLARAQAAAQPLAQRLDDVALSAERGWVVMADAAGITLARTVRGVAERYLIDAATLRSTEARWLDERHAALVERFKAPAQLKLDNTEAVASGPASAFDRIIAHGRRGLTIQRFKGLGEMNPEQLWKTTLDTAARTLLQVKVGDVEEAGQVFSTLMGDVVEPRRDFIVTNSLKVANLDV